MGLVAPGTMTKWGTVAAIGYVGERYYFMVDGDGSVSMMPADIVESSARGVWESVEVGE